MSLLALALWPPQDSSQFNPLLPLEHTGSYPRPAAATSHPQVFGLSYSGPGFQDVAPTTVAAPSSESLALNVHPLPDRIKGVILWTCTGM